MKKLLIVFLPFLFLGVAFGQAKEGSSQRNNLFLLLNYHLEKRGTEMYEFAFPDFAAGYERDIAGFGDHRFYVGARTGLYREYVLTGNGWDHPVGNRFFLGFFPSYVFQYSQNYRLQLSFLNDILLPDDYDETWLYWAAELSLHYFIDDFFLGLSATSGAYFYFDPRAYMIKVGIKAGYRF